MSARSHDQMYDAFGAYVRSQRHLAQLTLRQAAELASISNPYLSQIEHGLAHPSITVITALADALSVSTETLLLRAAGIMSPDAAEPVCRPEDSIRQDLRLDEGQKRALLAVLASFLGSSPGAVPAQSEPVGAPHGTPTTAKSTTSARPAAAGTASHQRRRS